MEVNQKELQNHLMKMMQWFHSYCAKNDIRYYALGGTMLGAVRHNGFIPWDDDIDIGVPRSDYEKLRSMIGNREYEGYFFETPDSPSYEYRYPYGKLYDTRTTLTEHTWPALRRGVFIDVFPLDGLGNNEKESVHHWNSIVRKSNYLWARTCAVRKERTIIKNAAIIVAHLVPKAIAGEKKLLNEMDLKCRTYDFDMCEIGGNVFGNWGEKEIMPSSIMGTPKLYRFGDMEIYGAEHANEYLTHLYGDWRKLPPVEKQITHHDFLELDLHTPYAR